MYMKSITAGNYDYDENEDEYMSDFLEYLPKSDKKDNVSSDISITSNALATITNEISPFDNNVMEYNNKEKNSLYNIAGYCLKSDEKTCTTCCNCIQSVGSKKSSKFQFSRLMRLTLDVIRKILYTLLINQHLRYS